MKKFFVFITIFFFLANAFSQTKEKKYYSSGDPRFLPLAFLSAAIAVTSWIEVEELNTMENTPITFRNRKMVVAIASTFAAYYYFRLSFGGVHISASLNHVAISIPIY